MKTEQMTEEEIIIRKAFARGENWGVTYSTWFSPSESDTEEQVQKAINDILGEEG